MKAVVFHGIGDIRLDDRGSRAGRAAEDTATPEVRQGRQRSGAALNGRARSANRAARRR